MEVILSKKDVKSLFKKWGNCVIVPNWDGSPCTLNKTDNELYYIVRWEEYDPCTDLMPLKDFVEYISEGVLLHVEDYNMLLNKELK